MESIEQSTTVDTAPPAPTPAAGAGAPLSAERVWTIASGLFATHERAAVLRRVTATIQALACADAAALLLYDRERDVFVPVVPSVAIGLDESWLQRQGLDGVQALAQRAAARDVLFIPDAAATPAPNLPALAGDRRPGAVCALPLALDDDVIAVGFAFFAQADSAPCDPQALRPFAVLAAQAIARVEEIGRMQHTLARLAALDAASRAIAAALAPEQVLQRIVEIAASVAGARYGALGVVGSDGYLTDFITTGITPEARRSIGPLPRGHGLLGVLIRQGQALRVPDIGHDPRRVGFPPNHPPMTSLLGVPIRVHDQVVGDLYLTDKIGAPAFTEEDQELIEMLAAHAGIAIENARLYAQVGDLAGLRERERIARDLHDGIIQDIYASTLQLDDLAEDMDDEAARTRLLALADHLSGVITDVRTYIQGLRARSLEGRLIADGLAALVREANGRGGVATTFSLVGSPYRLDDAAATTILHIAREALSNVARHAHAREATVELAYLADEVVLTVRDDGRGFDPHAVRPESHHGLRNLQARAEEAGGHLLVQSAEGAGTTVSATLPSTQ
jgi:signal transduction histidine kinase